MNLLIILICLIGGFLIGRLKFHYNLLYKLEILYIRIIYIFIRTIYRIRTGKSYLKELRKSELESHYPNGPHPAEFFREQGYSEDWIEDYIKTYK